MKTLRESSPVVRRAKTGKLVSRWVRLVQDGARYGIQKAWQQEGGILQESAPRWVERAKSQASIKEQAEFEFASLNTKREDRENSEFLAPMLAHKFDGRDITFPVFVQPKYDGFRMLTDGDEAWTRGLKEHVRQCVQHLIFDTVGHILDGELLLPGNVPLQKTASAAKRYQRGVSETLCYYVYDVVLDAPYSERLKVLAALLEGAPANVRLAPTYVANSADEVWAFHAKFVEAGFEGAIVRTNDSGYEVGSHTDALLKVKSFQDEEFQIVSVDEGKGSNVGLAILKFDAGNGKTFNAVPEGGHPLRAKLWKERHDLLGTWWTVRYFYKSAAGKPIFPVAVVQREEGE